MGSVKLTFLHIFFAHLNYKEVRQNLHNSNSYCSWQHLQYCNQATIVLIFYATVIMTISNQLEYLKRTHALSKMIGAEF